MIIRIIYACLGRECAYALFRADTGEASTALGPFFPVNLYTYQFEDASVERLYGTHSTGVDRIDVFCDNPRQPTSTPATRTASQGGG